MPKQRSARGSLEGSIWCMTKDNPFIDDTLDKLLRISREKPWSDGASDEEIETSETAGDLGGDEPEVSE